MNGKIPNLADAAVRNRKVKDGEVTRTEMVPPDGGWGWIILIGNCILMFLLPTSPVCYGVMYVALVEQQGISNTTASGITAVLLGIATFLGPVSTAMSSFYSHRKLALIGVGLMSVGLLFCGFSLNIIWLYFSFVLIGFGNSLGTPQIFLIGQEYFTTKRVTANAIASAAYTMGYVVLPIILLNLISAYSIRGAFFVWAAIMLNGFVGAMLYQPVERYVKLKVSPAVTFSDRIQTIEDGVDVDAINDCDTKISSELNSYGNECIESNNKNAAITEVVDTPTTPLREVAHLINGPTLEKVDTPDADSLHSIKEEEDQFRDVKPLDDTLLFIKEADDQFKDTERDEDPRTGVNPEQQVLLQYVKGERPWSFVSTNSMDSYCTAKTNFKSMMSVAPSEYFDVMGSWMSIGSLNDSKPLNGSVLDIPDADPYIRPEKVADEEPKPKTKCHRICGISLPYLSDIIKLEVLSDPVFLIIAVSSAVYRQVYYGYSSFLPVIAYQKELGDKIPFLLVLLAVSEIISKFGTGFIADRGWITARNLYMGSTIINCFSLMLTGFSRNLVVLAMSTVILGIGLGISSSLGPVLLVKYHSLELLPHSYGLMLLLSGAFTFVVLPIQGWSIDKTGSANYVCYIFASLCIVPLILWLLMPIAQKYNKTNKKSEE